jgi:hypothetical protein
LKRLRMRCTFGWNNWLTPLMAEPVLVAN